MIVIAEMDSAAVMPTEPERAPRAAGVNVTLTVQAPAGARLVVQVVVSEKSVAFAPVREIVPSAIAEALTLVMVRI